MTTDSDDRLLKRHEVERLTALSRSTLYQAMRDGAFPRPVRVGKRAVAWRLADIKAWLDTRPPTNPLET